MKKIKHIWFDFSDTIGSVRRDLHDKLRHESYSKVKNQPVTPELIDEFEKLYKENKHSNAATFHSLGLSPSFWSDVMLKLDPRDHYHLKHESIPDILEQISKIIPISIFSNVKLDKILPALNINPKLFAYILSASAIGKPKPALDGFYKVIELSGVSPEEILYIGDQIDKDVIPAKMVGLITGFIFGKEKEADYSFSNFQDILEFVKLNQQEQD